MLLVLIFALSIAEILAIDMQYGVVAVALGKKEKKDSLFFLTNQYEFHVDLSLFQTFHIKLDFKIARG